MSIVKMNLVFTSIDNLLGWFLAVVGVLSPVIAAAVQSLPDTGIMGNSARLLKQK
jgi:Cd2+/Zn2+-exporting ATPase/Cu+-exporting ATPase